MYLGNLLLRIVYRVPRYTFVPHLVTLGQIWHELSCGQAHFGARLSVQVPNDLEGHSPLTTYTNPSKSFPRHIFVPNLLTLGQICHELLCGEANFGARLYSNCINQLLHGSYKIDEHTGLALSSKNIGTGKQ